MKKLLSTSIAVGILASTSFAPAAFADVAANTLPSLKDSHNATLSTNGSNMNIQINGGQGGVGTLNWNSYNIGKDASVNYEFSAHNQTALNKVDAAGGLSQIYGKITSSGCQGCDYAGTGKVILLNPNGVLFGDGANVNLNSFTVSTMNGEFDAAKNQLKLDRDGNSKYGIMVQDGATIYGDKGVTFASDNVYLYNNSKISTNVGNNVGDTAFGKVKIVTSDGVNFTYYNNGAVATLDGLQVSGDKMEVRANGEITSGHIDIRNYSSNKDAQINLNGATLKATKAQKGNDGNIWLTSTNKVVVDKSNLTTKNGGNIKITANEKASIKNSTLNSTGKIDVIAQVGDAVVDKSTLTAAKDAKINAGNIASIQNNSIIKGKNILVAGKEAWASNSSVDADLITIEATNDVITEKLNLNDKKAVITAGRDVDADLTGVGNRQNGLVAKAGRNMKVTTDGTLSVSSLISGNDMTLGAKEIISGFGKTDKVLREEGDSADRAYIEVGGEFKSNPAYETTDSADLTADGKFNQRHHIQYGDGSEKILLVNKKPYVAPPTDPEIPDTPVNPPVDPEIPDTPDVPDVPDTPVNPPVEPEQPAYEIDEEQAQMLNKIPRQPESYSNVANISDGRTTFVDVFAAASQIEIVEDEEEE